jgi:hypothetical protein
MSMKKGSLELKMLLESFPDFSASEQNESGSSSSSPSSPDETESLIAMTKLDFYNFKILTHYNK